MESFDVFDLDLLDLSRSFFDFEIQNNNKQIKSQPICFSG
ncbi:hypothetical protein M595_4286 [Lyngbya aestuarii BL J]|uniref:Uncharacterized protein n=1 Tax=Lyngbya aestuarii BL J TaxID=1348334 RepID=U7QD13_9CYAN|nr:hypothetical protein M595_4286 [Lyngbya aestuarii BL J]